MEIIDPTLPAAPIQAPSAFSPQQSQGNRKKYIVIGIGITVFMLVIGIGSYFLGMKNSQAFIAVTPQSDAPPVVDPLPSKVPTPTTNPTAGWRTYLNKDWNLTIKYPPHLFENKGDAFVIFSFEPEPTQGWGMLEPGSQIRILKMSHFENPGQKFDALFKATVGADVKEAQEGVDIKVTKIKNTKIGNYDAVEYIHDGITPPKTDGRGPVGYSHIVLVKINNDTYIEVKNTSYVVQTTVNNDVIFNQMISTLQIK